MRDWLLYCDTDSYMYIPDIVKWIRISEQNLFSYSGNCSSENVNISDCHSVMNVQNKKINVMTFVKYVANSSSGTQYSSFILSETKYSQCWMWCQNNAKQVEVKRDCVIAA